jgi:paraquat-inducible protein B
VNAPEESAARHRRTVSDVHRSHWPGWIWGVPIAALGIVIWLLIRALSDRGISATVIFDGAAGMKEGDTDVTYLGMKVGTVRRLTLAPDGSHVIAELNLDKHVQQYLRAGSEFYLQGAQPSLSDPASFKAIVAGPSIVLVSGPGGPARHFSGHMGAPTERLAVSVPYLLQFSTGAGSLQVGSPVSLLGFTVGKVANVQLTVDPDAGRVSTAVLIVLDPTRLHLQNTGGPQGWGALMNTALEHLVQHGLRARLTQDPPVLGSERVTLDMVADAGERQLLAAGPYREIPVEEGGGLLAQVRRLPLAQIGENVRVATAQLKALTSSPQLEQSIQRLDSALAGMDQMVRDTRPQIAPTLQSVHQTVDSLRKTAGEIDATAAAARRTMAGSPASNNGNLQESLRELTEAARAVRTLANDIDQKPESLVRGR